MKLWFLFTLAVAGLFAQDSEPVKIENVNSRYTIEKVELPRMVARRISRPLKKEIDSLVGQRFDPQTVTSLAGRIRKEVHVLVKHRVEKGDQPEHVRLIYEAQERPWDEGEAKVTRLSYHSKQGTTAGLQLGTSVGPNDHIEFGVLTDADSLMERFSGINTGYSHRFGEHVRLRFEFEATHQQWNAATQNALLDRSDVPGIYRERYRMDPSIVITLAPGLSLSTGLSFQQFQTQFPAARIEAANAVTTTLRHRRRVDASDYSAGHEWDAGYSLRAATSLLDSDFAYVRHMFDVRYSLKYSGHTLTVRGLGGFASSENVPLYDRFTLGDSRTLRGWNKFDVAPIGGTRSAYASLQYTWKHAGAFYDTGSVWDARTPARARHAAGFLLALDQEGPYLAVGFPIRNGNWAPVFILGTNF